MAESFELYLCIYIRNCGIRLSLDHVALALTEYMVKHNIPYADIQVEDIEDLQEQ